MERFWLNLPEGSREIRTWEDVQRALWECPSLTARGALAAASRWDGPAGRELGERAVMTCLRECARRAGEFAPQALTRLTVGQVLYLVIAPVAGGLSEDQVLSQAADRLAGETVGAVAFVLRRMVERGYVTSLGGVYRVPGPVVPTWAQL
jgi:hypothetical protein